MITRNIKERSTVGFRQNYEGGEVCLYHPSVSPVATSAFPVLPHNACKLLFSALDSVPVFLARVCRLVTGSPGYACKQFCLTNTVVFKFLNWNPLDGHVHLVPCRPHLTIARGTMYLLPFKYVTCLTPLAFDVFVPFLSILVLPQFESLSVLFFRYPIFCWVTWLLWFNRAIGFFFSNVLAS